MVKNILLFIILKYFIEMFYFGLHVICYKEYIK